MLLMGITLAYYRMVTDKTVVSLQHAARYLANQEWVKNDSLKIVENTAVMSLLAVSFICYSFWFLIANGISHPPPPMVQILMLFYLDTYYHARGGSTSGPHCVFSG